MRSVAGAVRGGVGQTARSSRSSSGVVVVVADDKEEEEKRQRGESVAGRPHQRLPKREGAVALRAAGRRKPLPASVMSVPPEMGPVHTATRGPR